MRKFRLALAAWSALIPSALPAMAQTYRDSGGTAVQGVVKIPTPYVPLSPGQHNLAPTSATALTVPAGARLAHVCASSGTVEYTVDGTTTPTASLGMPLAAGSCVDLEGALVIANFRAFSAAGTLDVEYAQ